MNYVKYNLSFTAASLRPELSRVIAEMYLESESWEEAKQRVRSDNALQARSQKSSDRLERELRQRLQTLTRDQLLLLAHSTTEDQAAMAWLAMIKYNAFALEFSSEVLRDKLASFDPVLRPSDYEQFVDSKVVSHPELDRLASTTRTKVRNVLLRTLVEAGLLTPGPFLGRVQRPQLSPAATRVVLADDPRLLAGFLFTDPEISRL